MRAVLLVLALSLTGCMSASDMIDSLSNSDRSWCLSLTTVYGTVRVGGTGAEHASVLCNQEGLKVGDTSGSGGSGTPIAPAAIIIPAQPRVFIQDAPGITEVDPGVFDKIRKGRQ